MTWKRIGHFISGCLPVKRLLQKIRLKSVYLKPLKTSEKLWFFNILRGYWKETSNIKACNFIKKRLQHRCFPVKYYEIFKSSFFIEYLRWLLLLVVNKLKIIFISLDTGIKLFLLLHKKWSFLLRNSLANANRFAAFCGSICRYTALFI